MERPNIKGLRPAASRLLVAYLLCGPDFHTTLTLEEQMKAIGVERRQTFIEAREELQAAGYVLFKRNGRRGTLSLPVAPMVSSSIVGWMGGEGGDGLMGGDRKIDLSFYLDRGLTGSTSGVNGRVNSEENSDVTPDRYIRSNAEVLLQEEVTPECYIRSNTLPLHQKSDVTPECYIEQETDVTPSRYIRGNTTPLHQDDVTPSRYISLVDRMIEADAMEGTGSESSPRSPFQIRRKKQIELLQEAWPEIFPSEAYPLNPETAKKWISWCGNSVESAYWNVVDIRDRYHPKTPLSYVMSVLRKKHSKGELVERSARETSSTTSTVGQGRAEVGTPWDGELLEPSADWLEKRRRALEYAKSTGWSE